MKANSLLAFSCRSALRSLAEATKNSNWPSSQVPSFHPCCLVEGAVLISSLGIFPLCDMPPAIQIRPDPSEASRYRCESCASAFALRCTCEPSIDQPPVQSTTGPRYAFLKRSESIVQTYRMVLPVRRRIHCGMGRFCFWALASFCFVRKDLWDCHRHC